MNYTPKTLPPCDHDECGPTGCRHDGDCPAAPCSILHLTLTRKWFDMIASGEKREEYREIKPYWKKRLEGRHYDAVKFVNGYGAHRPWMLVEVKRIAQAIGRSAWGAPPEPVYMIALGRILESNS